MIDNELSDGEAILGWGALILFVAFIIFGDLIPHPWKGFLVIQPVVIWCLYERYKASKNIIKEENGNQ